MATSALVLGEDGQYAEVEFADVLPITICGDCELEIGVAGLFR